MPINASGRVSTLDGRKSTNILDILVLIDTKAGQARLAT